MKEFKIRLPRGKYGAETIRYAAYTLCGLAYVFLEREAERFKATIRPKSAAFSAGKLKKMFLEALEDEKFSESLFRDNQGLYFWMLKSAVNYGEEYPYEEVSALTPEQGEELDALIARVEAELKAGGKEGLSEIKKTWEEKYGGKTGKNRKK